MRVRFIAVIDEAESLTDADWEQFRTVLAALVQAATKRPRILNWISAPRIEIGRVNTPYEPEKAL